MGVSPSPSRLEGLGSVLNSPNGFRGETHKHNTVYSAAVAARSRAGKGCAGADEVRQNPKLIELTD